MVSVFSDRVESISFWGHVMVELLVLFWPNLVIFVVDLIES